GQERRLSTINPSAVLGPLLDDDPGTSAGIVLRLLDGSVPALPRIPFVIVDVRDVAAGHVRAMTDPEAAGRRFPMGERAMLMADVAGIVRAALPPERASKVPRRTMPDWAVRVYSLFDRDVRGILNELGMLKRLDSSASITLLGRPLITAEQAIIATTQSLLAQRLA
ncbi:MAG TPA: hypothetical protein VL017_04705, partial [Devosia sp.]|nr:hypothetical protein [Devosia sp.]